jgi:dipeptidase E
MQEAINNKQLYLSGGGNEKQSFPLDKFFFSELPQNGTFLYVPIALRGNELYPKVHLWMASILELHNRKDLKFETVQDLGNCKNVDNFDAIYIGGGNTWSLMKEIRDTAFDDRLIKYFKNGGIIYGGSAGAIVLGKKINTHDDKNEAKLEDVSGLNILDNYSVTCHFKKEQAKQYQEWALLNKSPIVCLTEETGLVIENDTAHCKGTESCTIYLADGQEKAIKPGEVLKL